MARTSKILRRSIFTFLQNYQYFTTTAALLAFPFAASIFLLQSSVSSSPFILILRARIHSLFYASGFPPSSILFSVLERNLSQTIAISVLALPSTISSFLFSKASVINALPDQEYPKEWSFSGVFRLWRALIHTQICNSLLTLSANATCFCMMFIAFNLADGLGLSSSGFTLFLSAIGAVVFSLILANTFIICNLALIISGMEEEGGFIAALKACVLIKGSTATALSLAMPINAALAAVESLFQYRIVAAYHDDAETRIFYIALEGMLIAYLYAVLLVLDSIVGCFFFRSCCIVQNRRLPSHTEIQDGNPCKIVKNVEDLP